MILRESTAHPFHKYNLNVFLRFLRRVFLIEKDRGGAVFFSGMTVLPLVRLDMVTKGPPKASSHKNTKFCGMCQKLTDGAKSVLAFLLNGEFVQDADEAFVDGLVGFYGLNEWDVDDLVIVDANHDVALPF